jgi:transposase
MYSNTQWRAAARSARAAWFVHSCFNDQKNRSATALSKRAACLEYGINWRTLVKMLVHAKPPGYRRKAKREQPVVGPHLAWIHEVLEHDKQEPVKLRHTAKRIFDRLKVERGYTGGYTMVKEAVRTWKGTTTFFNEFRGTLLTA